MTIRTADRQVSPELQFRDIVAVIFSSHTRTVVRECCTGDNQSQWGRAKFDHPRQRSVISTSNLVKLLP